MTEDDEKAKQQGLSFPVHLDSSFNIFFCFPYEMIVTLKRLNIKIIVYFIYLLLIFINMAIFPFWRYIVTIDKQKKMKKNF